MWIRERQCSLSSADWRCSNYINSHGMSFPCWHIFYSPFWDGTLGFIRTLCIFPQSHIFLFPCYNMRELFPWQPGSFGELSKIFSRNLYITYIVPHFVWEFEAEIVYVPKSCCGHTYKVSTWNSDNKCDFWHSIFSQDYFGDLVKR